MTCFVALLDEIIQNSADARVIGIAYYTIPTITFQNIGALLVVGIRNGRISAARQSTLSDISKHACCEFSRREIFVVCQRVN